MVLTGGDPAKRPDLVDLVEHGARQGLAMNVTPSGTSLVTRDLLRALRDAGMRRLAISVDGPDAATHDAFRRVQGSFAWTRRIHEDAEALGIERQVNTTLGAHNLRGLETMARFVADVHAVLWSVFVVVPVGRALSSLLLTADALEETLPLLGRELARIAIGDGARPAVHAREIARLRELPDREERIVGERVRRSAAIQRGRARRERRGHGVGPPGAFTVCRSRG
jgi:MoaA/NifB/PqqE/SkfB family radical SAM enzyme